MGDATVTWWSETRNKEKEKRKAVKKHKVENARSDYKNKYIFCPGLARGRKHATTMRRHPWAEVHYRAV